MAVDRAAYAAGLVAGMRLADARALMPEIESRQANPEMDREALARLARWCGQYSPWVTVEPAGEPQPDNPLQQGTSCWDFGLRLDISGCAHLFGGETAMARTIRQRLAAFGLHAHLAVADSLGAAWALARYGGAAITIVPNDGAAIALADLSPAALRLEPAVAVDLGRLGLRRIDDLMRQPRAALARRFGAATLRRLDQALGRVHEPISPDQEKMPLWQRRAFAEPIGHPDDIARAADELCQSLCRQLHKEGLGAQRLRCSLFLADGAVRHVHLGLARASRDAGHMFRLLAEHLPALEAGFGADAMTMTALVSEPLAERQRQFHQLHDPSAPVAAAQAYEDPELGLLIDRLGNRLGLQNIARFAPHDSHLPERAVRVVAPLSVPDGQMRPWSDVDDLPRPVRLLPSPERVETVAEVPDGPPVMFRWRGRMYRVIRAEGPERIAPEWWRDVDAELKRQDLTGRTRDYFRIEDMDGRRYWLYRLGLYPEQGGGETAPTWYLHGFFA